MASSKLRKAIGAVKDKTSISLAKVGSSTTESDLDVAIVKATCHREYPPDERHIREILTLTTPSRARGCICTIARRLNKTKNWVVALKALMLVRRLLTEGDPAHMREIFFATRYNTRLLKMTDFRDASGRPDAWHYSAFVRTYALYLNGYLEFRMQGNGGKDTGLKNTSLEELNTNDIFFQIRCPMQLLETILACRPAGAAKDNKLVHVALDPIVMESFHLYHSTAKILNELIDRFLNLEVWDMLSAHELLSQVAKQYDELDALYGWCRTVGIGCYSKYPDVEKISQSKLKMMNEFIHEKTTAAAKRSEPQQDINSLKALPPLGEIKEITENKREEKKETGGEDEPKEEIKEVQEEQGVLIVRGDEPRSQQGNTNMDLILFDDDQIKTAPESTFPTEWEAFKEESGGDCVSTMVWPSSQLSNQTEKFPGGFNTLLILDGMYQQDVMPQAVTPSGIVTPASASGKILESTSGPLKLAPSKPLGTDGSTTISSVNTNPFSTSFGLAPPAHAQISDPLAKPRLFAEEQLMWLPYQRSGMAGQASQAMVKQHPNQFSIGGFTDTF